MKNISNLCYSLVGTGNIDKALICDVNGQTTWASSPDFSVCHANSCAATNTICTFPANRTDIVAHIGREC
jgi:hypothetical protein